MKRVQRNKLSTKSCLFSSRCIRSAAFRARLPKSEIIRGFAMITRKRASQVQCVICMLVCSHEIGRIQCTHSYCFNCIVQWSKVKNTCPVCRQKITQIHKLNVPKASKKQFRRIQPQTIIVPENVKEDDSEIQWIFSQRGVQGIDFIGSLLFNRIEQIDSEGTEQEEEGRFTFSIIISNIRMI